MFFALLIKITYSNDCIEKTLVLNIVLTCYKLHKSSKKDIFRFIHK